MPDTVEINEWTAEVLGFPSLNRKAVADRLAQIGDLRTPTREETEEFLVEVLLNALRQIPSTVGAWSWGEFHDGGLQPLYDMTREEDWPREAVCSVDLGLGEYPAPMRPGESLTPRLALARNLTAATEALLRAIRERLEAAGVSPYGHRGFP